MQRLALRAEKQEVLSLDVLTSPVCARSEHQRELSGPPEPTKETLTASEKDPQKIAKYLNRSEPESNQVLAARQLRCLDKLSPDILKEFKDIVLDPTRPSTVRTECLIGCASNLRGEEYSQFAKSIVTPLALNSDTPHELRREALLRYFPDSEQERKEAVRKIFTDPTISRDLKYAAVSLLSSRDRDQFEQLLSQFFKEQSSATSVLTTGQSSDLRSLVSAYCRQCPQAGAAAIESIIRNDNVALQIKTELLAYSYIPRSELQLDLVTAIIQSNHMPMELRIAAGICISFNDTPLGTSRLTELLKSTLKEGEKADQVSARLMMAINRRGGCEEASSLALSILNGSPDHSPRFGLISYALELIAKSNNPAVLSYLTQQLEVGAPDKNGRLSSTNLVARSFRPEQIRALVALSSRAEEKLMLGILTSPKEEAYSRIEAAKYFIGFNNATANELFRDALRKSPNLSPDLASALSETAAKSLARRGDGNDLALVERVVLSVVTDSYTRKEIIEKLSRNQNPGALEALERILNAPALRDYDKFPAACALLKRNHQKGLEWLGARCAGSADKSLSAESAIAALAESGNPNAIQALFNTIENGAGGLSSISCGLATQVTQDRYRAGLHYTAALRGDSAMKEYAVLLDEATNAGINYPHRFTPEVLAQILHQPTPKPDTPRALVIFPTSDWNGAFGQFSYEMEQIMNKGYHLEFREAKTEMDVVNLLNSKARRGGADLLVLGAHGSREAMSFGAADPRLNENYNRAEAIDLEDVEMLKNAKVGAALKPNGSILLISCSVGEGEASANNVVNMLRQVFPHAGEKQIFGATVPTSIKQIHFDKKMKLDEVEYLKGKTYRAEVPVTPKLSEVA